MKRHTLCVSVLRSHAPTPGRSIVCTFFIPSNGGVGTIIGSAIFNIFVIVGATGTVACAGGKVLDIWWYPLTRDTFFYVLSIALLALALQSERDDAGNDLGYARITLPEACAMCGAYLLYIGYMVVNPKIVDKNDRQMVGTFVRTDLEKHFLAVGASAAATR